MKSIRQIGASGQISLGKKFAGRTVVIDSNEPGVWVIQTAQTIPDAELWLHQAAAAERLDRALTCLHHPPEAADLDTLEHHLKARGLGCAQNSEDALASP